MFDERDQDDRIKKAMIQGPRLDSATAYVNWMERQQAVKLRFSPEDMVYLHSMGWKP